MSVAHIAFGFFAVAVVLDMATTLYALATGARETTPAMRTLFGIFGPLPAILMTHSLVVALMWYLLPNLPAALVAVIAAGWWMVVVWNIVQIWRQRRKGN
jgi:hypothetical protein